MGENEGFKTTLSPEELELLGRKTLKFLENLNIPFGDTLHLLMANLMTISNFLNLSTEEFSRAMIEAIKVYNEARKDYAEE